MRTPWRLSISPCAAPHKTICFYFVIGIRSPSCDIWRREVASMVVPWHTFADAQRWKGEKLLCELAAVDSAKFNEENSVAAMRLLFIINYDLKGKHSRGKMELCMSHVVVCHYACDTFASVPKMSYWSSRWKIEIHNFSSKKCDRTSKCEPIID